MKRQDKKTILSKFNKDDLLEYLNECANHADFNVGEVYALTQNFIKYHKGETVHPASIKPMQELFDRWYSSLDKASPDYSVYASPFYFCDVWLCWINYSRKYLIEIQSPKSMFTQSIVGYMKGISNVLDLGCGFGYTTAALKEIFQSAKVVGTNIEGTSQFKMASELGRKHGFAVVGSYQEQKCDLIFASEYFEHIDTPVDHLQDVLDKCSPKFMLIANTFTSDSIGHFKEYTIKGQKFAGRAVSKIFNDELRKRGYEKVSTRVWNDRPTFWELKT